MQGILLAAGRGTRFGANKLLHPLKDGTPMALAAARNLIAALPNTLAVVNGEDPELMVLLEQAGLRVTVCPTSEEGMGASLAWGVAQSREADGWLIALADMPWIRPETVLTVARAVSAPHLIAAPVYRGRRGHPVAFGRGYGQGLMLLGGDEGARQLLETFASDVVLLSCEDSGVLQDIDLQEQIGS
jgi:molybdenum cofactor cytidylyltransferase